MYLLPIEIYLALVLVIPMGVCFAKWKYELSWIVSTVFCAFLSWIYFNLWMAILDPPDNGFTNAVYLLSGWLWLLPVFVIFSLIFWLMEKRLARFRKLRAGLVGFKACSVMTASIVIWNLIGRMSAERAILEARNQLKESGLIPSGKEVPLYEHGHWIVRYPDTEFKEIRLTRNGKMSWIGGPG